MTNLSNAVQYMLNSLVEHETEAGAGKLTFVAAYPVPGERDPAVADLWSEDADGVKRTGVVDDHAVFATDTFGVLEEAGLVTLERERTSKGYAGAAMLRAYLLTDAGRAAADYE